MSKAALDKLSILLRRSNVSGVNVGGFLARRFMATSTLTVKHDNGEKAGEFFIQIEGQSAIIEYI